MTSLSWLAIRAAIVSLQFNAPKLDAVTKQVISRFGLSRRRGSRAGKHKHCDRPKFTACLTDQAKVDDVIRGIPVVVGYRSTRYLEPGVQYQGRRDARTMTVKTERRTTRAVQRVFGQREISCGPAVDYQHEAQPRRPGRDVAR